MKKFAFVILFISFCFSTLPAKSIYVSTTGIDTNPGTIDLPLKTITKALAFSIYPGDSIIVRGGVYSLTSTISISPSGNQDTLYYLFAFPGERPILDFSAMAVSSSNRGIRLKGSYWYLKGFDIKGAGDNGMNISGSNNIVEFCALYENRDSGMQLGGGASNNKIINCDSYFNKDPGEGNADGFSPKLDVGTNNYFYGCRSWQNSDDGYDGYLRPSDDIITTYENCWCFKNGYREDGTASLGNGNGFKTGGSDAKTLRHNAIYYNCLSFDNRVKGFDQNNNKGSITFINCTAYNNGTNYSVVSALDTGKVLTVENCLALGPHGTLISSAVLTTDSWMRSDSVTASDFISIDTSGVRRARKPDGSLPDLTYMHLAPSSALIDAGTIVTGRPYNGAVPDLGCFETGTPANLKNEVNHALGYYLSNNYPNPFNPSTVIAYQVPVASHVTLTIFNILGKEITTLVNENKSQGTYYVNFNAVNLSSGVYLYTLKTDWFVQTKKMILIK